LWGYSKSYPVAEIAGADYATASSYINQSILDNPADDASLRSHLNNLRNIPNSLVKTYTYKPLIGMTSQTDPAGKTTFYEYDNFNRLKNIKDYQGNIAKNFQYNYLSSCGTNCVIYPLQTFNGSNTIGYPVGVFNVNGALLGQATSQAQYLTLWNGNSANQAKGVLSAGTDALHFNLTLASGQTAPSTVTGLRYYQFDIPWTQIDGIRNLNGEYVDFGDGATMRLGKTDMDANVTLAPNTVVRYYPDSPTPLPNSTAVYFVHNYPDNSVKTVTVYHNDDDKRASLDNGLKPATSLTKVKNSRGNFPQYTNRLTGSCLQEPSYWTVANVANWNSITSIQVLLFNVGDGTTVCTNTNFAQDFMANNKGLKEVYTSNGNPYSASLRDVNFKLSRLKTDWNTYFTNLEYISITEDNWNHEDLTALTKLNAFGLFATNQNHSNDPTNNPVIPIQQSVIDNIYIQIAAGAGQTVSNGIINIYGGGTLRGHSSDAAVAQLKAKGWTIKFDGNNQ